MNSRKITYLIFILLCGILMFPKKSMAENIVIGTRYKYADIKICYLENQDNPVSTTTIKKTGYKGCLQLDNTRTTTVDKDRLKNENACPDGYELYNVSQGEDPDKVFGSGCIKELKATKTLYCGYYGDYEKVMIIYDGNNIQLRVSEKREKETGEADGEYVNEPLDIYVPMYNDKSWRLEEDIKVVFNHTDKYINGVLNGCPQYIFTVKTGEQGNYKISEYVFSDDEEATSNEIEEWSYPGYLRRNTSVTDYQENTNDSNNNDYYSSFESSKSCDNLLKNAYTKTCTYNIGDYRFIMYMNKDNYHITVDYSGSKIQTYFTFNELKSKNKGECPNELYWWSDGYLYSIALEDIDNKLYYRNKVTLTSSSENLIIPEHCIEKIPIKEIDHTCESLLGNPITPGQPAYYLQIIFDVMKYIAIILLIVLSIMDFIGAVTSQDDKKLKEAMNKMIIRLICCVAIFVLPTLIQFVFTLLDIYSPTTCGIK